MTLSRSDEDLVRSVAMGDDEALMPLYQRYGRSVYSLAFYISKDRATAEEITQDVFIALWQKAKQFDQTRGRLGAWLLQITRNLAIDNLRFQRRRQLQQAISLEAVEPYLAISNGPLGNDHQRELNGLLQKLPAEQRQAIELAYFQGYTHDEIAAKCKLPIGTVKSRILLGLRKLQSLLK